MSLNSFVTADGAEIGRAQAMQAQAARVEPEAAMNPVLLKPGADGRSQVVLLGRPVAEVGALDYRERKPVLLERALECLADLRSRYDVVVCEGAGSPAEINLRDRDIANMGLATAAGLPVVVVGDIDAAASSPRCTGRWRCCRRRTSGMWRAGSSTSSAATPGCWRPAWRCCTG